MAGGAGFRRELRRTSDELRGRRSRRADDGRRDERRKTDTTDTVSPCTPSEDLEDLERNRRNDSDVGAAERLSSLERKKRAVLKFIGSADTLLSGKAFLLTELAEEEEKTLRKARSCAAKAGNSFSDFRP